MTTLGRFQVVAALGRGGASAVFEVRLPGDPRRLALKVLELPDAEVRLRFAREGELLARLRHAGILQVHEAGSLPDGRPYLLLPLIEGASLRARLREGRLSPAEAVELATQVADALAHAHAQGVVHRDVKPENLLFTADGRVQLADFGLAFDAAGPSLTHSGVLGGTPAYAAPEQLRGGLGQAGPPADVWAVGVVLYESLTARRPFPGTTLPELMTQVLQGEPPPLRTLRPQVSPALAELVARCLEKDPARRPADGAALAEALRQVAGRQGAERGLPRRLAPTGLALLFLGGVLALSAWLNTRPAPPPSSSPPELTLAVPGSNGLVLAQEVELEGEVRTALPWAEVWSDGPPQRVLPGRPFRLRRTLQPGRQEVVVHARDAAGRECERRLALECRPPPPWIEELPARARPPWPLPEGLTPGDRRLTATNARDGSLLVWIAPGSFRMGSDNGERNNWGPSRQVTFIRGYWLGRCEVTWAQWDAFASATGASVPEPSYTVSPDHPVHKVSHEQARAYCAWAGLRLPSEAEWEFAARGSRGRAWPWGDADPGPEHCNGRGQRDGYEFTAPVGSFPRGATPAGCLDLAGNLGEWVVDGYATGYPPGDVVDPAPSAGDPTDGRKVYRGGSWDSERGFLDPRSRESGRPREVHYTVGFRVARDAR